MDSLPGCWKYMGGREVWQTLPFMLGFPSKKYCSTACRSLCWTGISAPSLKASARHLGTTLGETRDNGISKTLTLCLSFATTLVPGRCQSRCLIAVTATYFGRANVLPCASNAPSLDPAYCVKAHIPSILNHILEPND